MKIKIFITLFTVSILVSSFFISASSVKITNFSVNSNSLSEAELADWAVGSPSWISVSPSSGKLEGQESQKVTVSVDTSDMSLGAYSGDIEISSNVGSKTIELIIIVPRAKTSQLPFYQLFTMLQEKFPLFYRLFRNLQVFQ